MLVLEDDGYSYCLHMSGQATTLQCDEDEDDVVAKLRAVVEEVTGRPVEKKTRPRIGFLP